MAAIDLNALLRWAGELDLDGDPAELRRTIDLIGGKVTSLRAYAKRLEIARNNPEA
jgi:hypothetical protein